MTPEQSAMTRGFARALGPFLIILAAATAARSTEMGAIASGFFQDGPLALVTGAFTLGLGCAMLAAHHHFNSLAAVVVTVFGIVTALRGVVLLISPRSLAPLAEHLIAQPGVILIPVTIAFLIGAYLSFVGWFAKKA
jgi:hypothetical protein